MAVKCRAEGVAQGQGCLRSHKSHGNCALSVISPMLMHRVHSNIEDGLETVTVLTVVDREAVRETPREALEFHFTDSSN